MSLRGVASASGLTPRASSCAPFSAYRCEDLTRRLLRKIDRRDWLGLPEDTLAGDVVADGPAGLVVSSSHLVARPFSGEYKAELSAAEIVCVWFRCMESRGGGVLGAR